MLQTPQTQEVGGSNDIRSARNSESLCPPYQGSCLTAASRPDARPNGRSENFTAWAVGCYSAVKNSEIVSPPSKTAPFSWATPGGGQSGGSCVLRQARISCGRVLTEGGVETRVDFSILELHSVELVVLCPPAEVAKCRDERSIVKEWPVTPKPQSAEIPRTFASLAFTKICRQDQLSASTFRDQGARNSAEFLRRSGWQFTPHRNSCRPSSLSSGRGIPANATSAWVSQTAFQADATERVAASFCLSHPGAVLPEERRLEGFPSTSSQRKEWVF